MTNNNFAGTTAISTSTPVAPLDFAALSDTDKVKSYLANRFNLTQLHECLSYDENERAILQIPADRIQGAEPGYFRVKLCFPTIDGQGNVLVKVGVSFKQLLGTNECTLLTRGGGDGSSMGWMNINSNPLLLGDLFSAGFFAESAKREILQWALSGEGSLSLVLPTAMTIHLRPTKIADKPKVGSRNVPAGRVAGEDCGLGMHALGFQGATLLPKSSDLLYAVPVGAVVSRTVNELRQEFGLGVATRPAIGHAEVTLTPNEFM